VDSVGNKVGDLRYHPYGGTRYSWGSTPTGYRFTGQREDATIGLYFFNARYYDPALGRFISADTVVPSPANPQDLNRYAYVRNNPLKYTDPSGQMMAERWSAAPCRPPDEPPAGDDLLEYARWNLARAYYAQVTWGPEHPSIPGHMEEYHAALFSYQVHTGDLPEELWGLAFSGFGMWFVGAADKMGRAMADRSLYFGQMPDERVGFLRRLAQKYRCTFIVCGRRSETDQGLANRRAAFERYEAGKDAPEFGVPGWRNTGPPSGGNEFDYFPVGIEDLPEGLKEELRVFYGSDLEFDNWNRFDDYATRPPGGIVFDPEGNVYRNFLEPWQ